MYCCDCGCVVDHSHVSIAIAFLKILFLSFDFVIKRMGFNIASIKRTFDLSMLRLLSYAKLITEKNA